jgi:hypothetical protein
MKKVLILASLIVVVVMSSCSFESYSSQCPAYSHHNKMTKHGEKAQTKYARKN